MSNLRMRLLRVCVDKRLKLWWSSGACWVFLIDNIDGSGYHQIIAFISGPSYTNTIYNRAKLEYNSQPN